MAKCLFITNKQLVIFRRIFFKLKTNSLAAAWLNISFSAEPTNAPLCHTEEKNSVVRKTKQRNENFMYESCGENKKVFLSPFDSER